VHSLSRRLLFSVSVPLALFFGVMMWVLDTGFRALSERSIQEVLDSQMVSLIAAADPQPDGGYAPEPQELDPRLRTPRSGLYAEIRSPQHEWHSPSTAGVSTDFGALLPSGERNLVYGSFGHDRVAIESRSIEFEGDTSGARSLTFSVAVSLSPYEEQLWRFRQQMLGWFMGLMAVLLLTLAALLHWVLAPARRMEREIRAVEEGRSEALSGGYPRELSGVATNLNALLVGERKRVSRYRDTLGNLAHSLKTPLAVVRGALAEERLEPGVRRAIEEQVARMDGVVAHHLQRAATVGPSRLAPPVPVRPVAEKLVAALSKVYRDKAVEAAVDVAEGIAFRGVEGDLMELLGNLLDNAYKWCAARVRVSAARGEAGLELRVEDDGPGIPPSEAQWLIERGVRADESVPGHGIGLATVRDVAQAYSGTVTIERSPLGGARVAISLRD
jgi:two-component system, OmpR family, sensor histidine kinase PhoQ